MNVLLVWPRFPKSYWSFEKVLELAGTKALVPPLGLVTVAALLPQTWNMRLVDKAVRDVTEADWAWADMVMLSSMIVQRDDFLGVIREAATRGIPVAVGGPYVTSVPEDAEEAGADYIVMDEGEITIPMMVEEFLRDPTWRRGAGEKARRYTAMNKKPEMEVTPPARFDLLDMNKYESMSVQYFRGCPFLCEFCDIINLYGRVPRTKPVEKILAEFQILYDLGWRSGVFLVDDNFIGNKKNVKALLRELLVWQQAHGMPFYLQTEASIDLAADEELLDLMIACNFDAVFLGIETPDVESLELTRKHQNNRESMQDSIRRIQRKGMRVMAGFIIGFDGEKPGAGDRICTFIEQCNVTHGLLSMLQVLPNTGLYTRLSKEGRLKEDLGTVNQTTVLNFVPTRPTAEITREYLGALQRLYDPVNYMTRVYGLVMEQDLDKPPAPPLDPSIDPATIPQHRKSRQDKIREIRLYLSAVKLIYRQGIKRSSRKVFWTYLRTLRRERPEAILGFLAFCAHNEHFIDLTEHTRRTIEPQLDSLPDEVYVPAPEDETGKKKRAPVISSHMAAE